MPRALIGCASVIVILVLTGCSSQEEPQPPQDPADAQVDPVPIQDATVPAQDVSHPAAPVKAVTDANAPDAAGPDTDVPDANGPDVSDLNLPPLNLPEPQEPRPIDIDSQRILDDDSAESLPKLVELLKHENPAVRLAAAKELNYREDSSAITPKPLAEALLDRNPEVAEAAARTLSERGDQLPSVRAQLVRALGRDDDDVLIAVLRLLQEAEIKDASAVPALRRILRLDHDYQAELALQILAGIGPAAKSAVPDVLPWMNEDSISDVGEAAGEALGRFGATDELLRLARSGEFYEEMHALHGLGFVEPTPSEVRALLLETARNDDFNNLNRDVAVESLGRTRPMTKPVFDALEQFLKDSDDEVRTAAAAALGHIEPKTEAAAELLLQALQDEDDEVRAAATKALGGYQTNPQVRVRALLLASQDSDFSVSDDAQQSLAKSVEEMLPLMLEILVDPRQSEQLRLAAAGVLGDSPFTYDHEEAIKPAAIRVLENAKEPDALRCLAAVALLAMDEHHPAQEAAIIAGLKPTQPVEVRKKATWYADNVGTAAVVPALIAALDDPEGDVAGGAAASLGDMGEKAAAAVPALCRVARLPDHAARWRAISALGSIGSTSEQCTATLLEIARQEKTSLGAEAGSSLVEIIDASREVDDDYEKGAPAVDPAPIIRVLSDHLSSEEDSVREEAAESLGTLADLAAPAVPALAKALSDKNDVVRYQAASALAAIGPAARSAEAALIRVADNDGDYARDNAIEALGKIDGDPQKIVPILTRALKDDNMRFYAITALKSYAKHATPAVAELTEALGDAEEYIRSSAAETLGKVGPKAKAALPKLTDLVKQDGDLGTRDAAATAVLQIAPESDAAQDVFAAALRGNFSDYWMQNLRKQRGDTLAALYENALGHEDAAVRRGALAELKELSNPAPFEAAFAKALGDSEPDVRLQAALALARIGGHAEQITPILMEGLRQIDEERRWELQGALSAVGSRAAPSLAALAADASADEDLRRRAIQMLGQLGQSARKAVPTLKTLAQDAEPPLRTYAALALRQINWNDSEAAVPALLEGLRAEDAALRAEAAAALGHEQSMSEEVVSALLAALEDADPSVRNTAAYSLHSIAANRSLNQKFSAERNAKILKLLRRDDTRSAALTVLSGQETVPAEAVPLVIEMLGDEQVPLYQLAPVLVRSGEPGQEALLKVVRDESASLAARGRALEALRQFDSPSDATGQAIRKAAEPLLKSEQSALRLAAAATLAWRDVATEAVLTELVAGLREDDYDTHRHAIDAFQQLGPKAAEAIPLLTALLEDESADIRRRALWALGAIGSESESESELAAQVATLLIEHIGREQDEGVREEAGRVLQSLGSGADSVIAETLKATQDKPVLLAGLQAWSGYRHVPAGMAEVVRPLLTHEDEDVALAAAIALARIAGDSDALPVLVAGLESEDENAPRYVLLDAIGKLGEDAAPAVPVLLKLMQDEETADVAVIVLGRLGEAARPAVPALAEAFKNPRLIGAAGEALRKLGPVAAEAVPVLLESLRYEPRFHEAVNALAQMGPRAEPAVPILTEQLKDEYQRASALWGLGQLGPLSADAVPEIAKALSDQDPQVRSAAASALGQIGAPARTAAPEVIALLEDSESDVRSAAIYAVGDLAAPADQAVPPLLTALEDESPRVRQAAAHVLGRYEERAAAIAPKLVERLTDESSSVRAAAAESLGRLGLASEDVIAQLITRHQTDDSEYVQVTAAQAVWKLDPAAARQAKLPPPPPARAQSAAE